MNKEELDNGYLGPLIMQAVENSSEATRKEVKKELKKLL